ncbi:MAG: hypothetical protein HY594_00920 [Candidatus Omnitrophica bacterium]|nr:hypothetical protein [Candidatus Omnitrophota bacterium]
MLRMIEINLIPADQRLRIPLGIALFSPRRIAALGAVLCVAATALLGIWRIGLEKSYARMNAQWKTLETSRSEWEALRNRVAMLETQAEYMKQLRGRGLRWAPRLQLLSEALVPDVWLTELSIQPVDLKKEAKEAKKEEKKKLRDKSEKSKVKTQARNRKRVVVAGAALVPVSGVEPSPISVYLQSFKKHPKFSQNFDGVEVKSVERQKIGTTDVSEFLLQLDVAERP